MAAPTASPAEKHPQGMVLAFTLCILLLMTLMGTAILLNSRTELNISSNTSLGRNAFAAADTAARIATLMGRILLHPELGNPKAIVDGAASGAGPAFPLTIEVNANKFNLARLRNDEASYNYTLRYIRAGREDYDAASLDLLAPHIVFKTKLAGVERTVATASLALDHQEPVGAGMSLGGGDAYDGGGGGHLQIVLAVSVNGRALSDKPTPAGTDGAFDGGTADIPHSVITTLFRETM
jgi:hypothetical protein